uniref:Uncharacterized protein n=1 Tax=Aegilops tauschii TaxID=37682 RepID=R7WA00_AEGTA
METVSDLSKGKAKKRKKPGEQAASGNCKVLKNSDEVDEHVQLGALLGQSYGVQEQQHYTRKLQELSKEVKYSKPKCTKSNKNGYTELLDVQYGKQSSQMISELLAPQGAVQSYTELMQQMTVHQNPITSTQRVEEEEDDEGDEAHDYNSECNSDENETDPNEDYLEFSSEQNESDAEEDYLEQNTVSCGHFGGNHERSELQLLEQSWNNFDTVVEQDLLTTQK